ncbi:MAG: cytochrome c biogenesis protein CcsA, partial [Berryella intestinalis]|nr:cytochrome c biogenesis protein CcsA [Berryella intestinalis]
CQWLIFVYAPEEQVMGMAQKIFYIHLPLAWWGLISFGLACVAGALYLKTRAPKYDLLSASAVELGMLFCTLTLITGSIWGRHSWGVWWTWDPRLTTYLILMLLCIAYFVLRNSIDEPERRATYSAVIGIIAFVDAPITMMITRFIPDGKHPVVVREGGMTPEMALCVALALIGMVLIMFALYRLRFRQVRMAERVEALKQQLED